VKRSGNTVGLGEQGMETEFLLGYLFETDSVEGRDGILALK
jgi:hypothetical protein